MCGIAGLVSIRPEATDESRLSKMIQVQAHRGPDGQGTWYGGQDHVRVGLGSIRLAILDLSDAALQPMFSPSARQVLVYNGEIYNYRELRTELEDLGVVFRTRSDTEVVLHALLTWREGAFERMNGMWALAWLDLDTRRLLLSRDRFGIKPLYWYADKHELLFSSEIKAILAASNRRFAIDDVAVGRFLGQSQLDAQSQTFFAGIEAFKPGHFAWLDLADTGTLIPAQRRYWRPPHEEILTDGIPPSLPDIRETFLDSVRLQLRSDVPVGVLLSGGVDSSSLAAAMRTVQGPDAELTLLSFVSDDARYSEEPFIERMATHLGTPARTARVRFQPDEAFQLLKRVTWFNDEPVGGFSSVGHYALMRRAKELNVPVILSGQGADELLCGYLKYWGFHVQSLARTGYWGAALRVISDVARQGTLLPQLRVSEAKRYMPAGLQPRWIDIRGPRLKEHAYRLDIGLGEGGVLERQLADLSRFSLPALLHYEDRMSMAMGREIRVPFLDHRLVNQLLPLAPKWKMRDGWSKWVFRKAMEADLPPEIAWRKDKRGFSSPQSEWLKNDLRPQVEAILRDPMFTAELGFIDQPALRRRYEAYCRYPTDRGPLSFKDIFNPLAFEIWARCFASFLEAGAA
jgi:asparagine synthase (glutamine-hydrolysing)